MGAQCAEVYGALCDRASGACGASIPDCLATNVAKCCQDKCNAFAISSEDDVHACTNDIASASCSTVLGAEVPPSCAGVIKLPQ